MIVLFLLKKKWKSFSSIKLNFARQVTTFLGLLLIIVTALTFGRIYDIIFRAGNLNAAKKILTGLCYSSLWFPVVMKFFPSIAIRQGIVQKFYPINRIKAATIELAYSLLSRVWMPFLLIFVLVFYFFSIEILAKQAIDIFILGVFGVLFAETVIGAYYRGNRFLFFVIFITSAGLSFLPFYFNKYGLKIIFESGIIAVESLFYILIYQPIDIAKIQKISFVPKFRNTLFNILVASKDHRLAVSFSFLLQLILTIAFITLLSHDMPIVKFYLLSNVIMFSYCYNNLWGFFPTLAINMYLTGKSMKEFLTLYMKLILPSLIINLTLLSICLLIGQLFSIKIILGYLCLSIFTIVCGIVFSFIKMKPIEKSISFDRNNFNTSLLPTHIVGVVGLILGGCENYNLLFYNVLVIVCIISVILLWALFKRPKFFMNRLKHTLVADTSKTNLPI